jgi:hypothetical protein
MDIESFWVRLRLKPADAVQAASALAINAAALVTHDRDFSCVRFAAYNFLTAPHVDLTIDHECCAAY